MWQFFHNLRQLWLIPAALIFVTVVGGSCWKLARNQEDEQARQTTSQALESISDHLEARVRQNALALQRMALRIRDGNEDRYDYWAKDARRYVQDVNEYRAVEWINRDLHIQWIEPLKGNEKALGLDLTFEPRRRAIIHRARDLKRLSVSRTIHLVQGGQGFLIYSPMFKGKEFVGIIAGVCLISTLADSIPRQLRTEYDISIWDGDTQIYPGATKPSSDPQIAEIGLTNLLGTHWKIQASPTKQTMVNWASPLPNWIIGSTLLSAILITFSLYQSAQLRKHALLERDRLQTIETNNEILEQILEKAPVGMALSDGTGSLLRVNRSLCEFLGYTEAELLELKTKDVTYPEDSPASLAAMKDLLAGTATNFETRKRYVRKNGDLVWGHLSASVICDAESKPLYILAQIVDQTNQQEREHELAALAELDALTGLANRRALDARLLDAVVGARLNTSPFSIIMIDVDHFKKFNDELGHVEGDRVLQTVAKILQRVVRASDFVARFGGEEFFVLCTRPADAMRLAERVREAIEKHPWEGRAVTASLGVTEYTDRGMSPSDILAVADTALYDSKARGRNRVSQVDATNFLRVA